MLIPTSELSQEALTGLIEAYIHIQTGSDYDPTPMDTKIAQVRRQVERNELLVSFSELHETVTLVSKDEINAKNGGVNT